MRSPQGGREVLPIGKTGGLLTLFMRLVLSEDAEHAAGLVKVGA